MAFFWPSLNQKLAMNFLARVREEIIKSMTGKAQ